MKTMKDFHYLFLKCQVLLLADVFEKFRNNSLNNDLMSRLSFGHTRFKLGCHA